MRHFLRKFPKNSIQIIKKGPKFYQNEIKIAIQRAILEVIHEVLDLENEKLDRMMS